MNNLNKQYFKKRKIHLKESKRKKKLTLIKRIFNLVIAIILIVIYSVFQDYLSKKIDASKKLDARVSTLFSPITICVLNKNTIK